MKVIVIKDTKTVGKLGDVINVSDGYARNFLIPKNIAVEATQANMKELATKKAKEEKQKDEELAAAKALVEKLENIEIVVKTKAGEGGRLFGSITTKDITEALQEQHKIELDKKKLVLENPIKQAGVYTVEAKLYYEITAKLKVNIKTI